MRVQPLWPQQARLAIIRQVGRQNLLVNALPDCRIFHREKHFDALIEIPRHPVCAAEIDLRVPAIFKLEDAAMFQKTPDNTTHPNAAANSAQTGHQRTLSADNQVNLYPSLRGAIESANYGW